LKERGEIIDLIVSEEGILLDAQFIALALHDVDRIMQHALD